MHTLTCKMCIWNFYQCSLIFKLHCTMGCTNDDYNDSDSEDDGDDDDNNSENNNNLMSMILTLVMIMIITVMIIIIIICHCLVLFDLLVFMIDWCSLWVE